MKRILSVLLSGIVALAFVPSCSKDGVVLVTWKAGKDQGSLKIGEIRKELVGQIQYQPQLASDLAWNKQTILDRYVAMELNYQDQLEKGMTNQPDFPAMMNALYLRQYYIAMNTKAQESFFKKLSENPVDIVKASHILITVNEYTNVAGTNVKLPAAQIQALEAEKENLARNILESLKASKNLDKDFSNAAALNSDDTGNAKRGGDLGWFTKGQMVPEFEKACFDATTKGLVKSVVKTQFGYHIIYVTEAPKKSTVKGVEAIVGKLVYPRMQSQLQNQVYLSERAKWIKDIVTYDGAAKTLKVGNVTYDSNTIKSLPDDADVSQIGKSVYKWKDVRDVINIFVPGFTNSVTPETVNMQINNFKNFWFFVQQSLDAGVQNSDAFKKDMDKQKKEAMKQIASQNLEKDLKAKAIALVDPKAVREQYEKNKAQYMNSEYVGGKMQKTQMTFEQSKSRIEDELSRGSLMALYNGWKQEVVKKYDVKIDDNGVKQLMELEKNEIEAANKKRAEQMKLQQGSQKKMQKGNQQNPQLPNQ
jgi:hypothetical protein